jgi:hypothetical protein
VSADLHIHVAKTEEEIKHATLYQKKTFWGSDIGPAYHEFLYEGKWYHEEDFYEKFEDARPEDVRDVPLKDLNEKIVDRTENIWVGEVSWLKAALFGDSETYIPDTVAEIHEACCGMKTIDDDMIDKVKKAFELKNNTIKENGVWNGSGYRLAKVQEVVNFLEKNKGHKSFTISW